MGDGASGVETAPKLEIERGESSAECLRLKPIVAVVVCWELARCREMMEDSERRLGQ